MMENSEMSPSQAEMCLQEYSSSLNRTCLIIYAAGKKIARCSLNIYSIKQVFVY